MGEEARMTDYEPNGGENDDGGGGGDDARVTEWEMGLPCADDLTPLSQPLISPELALAFSISPEPCRTQVDVNRASEVTLSNLCGSGGGSGSGGQLNTLSSNNNFKPLNDDRGTARDPMVVEPEENGGADHDGSGSESRKMRKLDSEEADSVLRPENSADDPSARTLKRPRLVWTPQLHKRFVDVVAYLGVKNAVPKTIMQLMNVEGLTRENVASHLQKYRLYLKRMHGLSNEGPSSSDQLFASTPVPQSLHESGSGGGSNGPPPPAAAAAATATASSSAAHANGHLPVPMPTPYHQAAAGAMMPGSMYGHLGMPQLGNNHHYHHYHHHHGFDRNAPPYNMLQQKEWSGNNYGSVVSYPHHHPHQVLMNEKPEACLVVGSG